MRKATKACRPLQDHAGGDEQGDANDDEREEVRDVSSEERNALPCFIIRPPRADAMVSLIDSFMGERSCV
jgi:hypothetical protein